MTIQSAYAAHMSIAVTLLTQERQALATRMEQLLAEMRDVKVKGRELDTAISTLTGSKPTETVARAGDLKGATLALIREAGELGTTPRDIFSKLSQQGRQTSEASVQSTASRLKGDGFVETRNGRWFAKNKEGPGVSAPEPSESLGPRDGSRGLPVKLAPEGSKPSGSTSVREKPFSAGDFADDLDDDVPF